MPRLDVHLEGDNCWADLKGRISEGRVLDGMQDRARIRLAFLPGGMQSGKTSVTLRIDLPHYDLTILCETSLALLEAAVVAAIARHGD